MTPKEPPNTAGKNFRDFAGEGDVPGDRDHDPLARRLWHDRERQVKALSVELGAALDGRTVIYLDTCFWIHLRDAQRGELGVRGAELLGRVRGAVASGAVIFPLSDMTLFEVFKQTPTSRRQTAQLMAELSQGVSIVGSERRMATEIAHLIKTSQPGADPSAFHPLHHLVWTRGLGVMGLPSRYIPGTDEDVAVRIQRRAIEIMWREVTPDMILDAAPADDMDDDFLGLAAELNRDVARHHHQLDGFKAAYHAEAEGVADLTGDVAMDVMTDCARIRGVAMPAPGSADWNAQRGRWCTLIAAGLKKGPRPRRRLRTLHAFAGLHAALRWNKGQKLEPNDIYDFEHAAAALGYCQAFFTERPLKHMVTAGNLALDKLFGCDVVHGLADAIAYIAELARPPGRAQTQNGMKNSIILQEF
jgi:hypothetical protein